MLIEVTQADIDAGKKDCISHCAVALAANRVCTEDVYVSLTHIHFYARSGEVRAIEIPEVMQKFISDFDAGKKVKPVTFVVDVEV